MRKELYFDMDGTLVDLYREDSWLLHILEESTASFEKARPIGNMSRLARLLNKLQRAGWELNIITWLPRGSSEEYQQRVTRAKAQWLHQHLRSVQWDCVIMTEYGINKATQAVGGILFDDDISNRFAWRGHFGDDGEAFSPQQMMAILSRLA